MVDKVSKLENCDLTISISPTRAVYTTLKMGTSTLRTITTYNPDFYLGNSINFFSKLQNFLGNKYTYPPKCTYIETRAFQTFISTDKRPLIFFIRDPYKAFLAGIQTVLEINFELIRDTSIYEPELFSKLNKIDGISEVSFSKMLPDDVLQDTLRFALKRYPDLFLTDSHISNTYYQNLLQFLLHLEKHYSLEFDRVYLLDLDNYDMNSEYANKLVTDKVILEDRVYSLSNQSHIVEKVIFSNRLLNNTSFRLLNNFNMNTYKIISENFQNKFFSENNSYI